MEISLHEQNLLLAFNSKAWEQKEQPTEWEQQVKKGEPWMQSILNLARHLTLVSDSILIWKARKQGQGKWTTTRVENWLNHWTRQFGDQCP